MLHHSAGLSFLFRSSWRVLSTPCIVTWSCSVFALIPRYSHRCDDDIRSRMKVPSLATDDRGQFVSM